VNHPVSLSSPAWSRTEFEARLREQGKAYHIHHPFNVMLNTGKATPEQIRGWVANRFSYQVAIPVKDADRKSTRLNSSHNSESRMPSSA
jgi:pyrroloquinoline-quinone synthase